MKNSSVNRVYRQNKFLNPPNPLFQRGNGSIYPFSKGGKGDLKSNLKPKKQILSIIGLIIILSVFIATECFAENGKLYLERGLKAYNKDADFDKTISELQKAIELGLKDRADLIQARLYLGFAYVGKGQRINAVVEFAKVIHLDPERNLDPRVYSSKIVTVFNETKQSLTDSLTIISTPGGADVYLDGKKVGVTPLKLNSVVTGDHILKVAKEFFQPKELNFRVDKGEDNRVQVQLDKAEVEVRLTSNLPEAIVYVSGKPTGKTPLLLKVSLDKEINVKLAKEEFLDRDLKIKLSSGGITLYGTNNVFPIKDGVGEVLVELSPAPIPGSLNVLSIPSDAIIYLDGIEVGKTPLDIAKVTPGNREVRVIIQDFDNATKKVEIASNKEALVEFILGGVISFSSVPDGAQVSIDGKYSGVTPFKTGRLPIGSHQVKFSKEKYKDKNLTVLLERGQEKELNIRLSAQKGSLSVSSDPSGAEVYLDGESKGNTPLFIYGLSIGEHSLKLTKTDCNDSEAKISIEENELSWYFGKLIKR
jgi:tetratricopeptide (TPR) repeat protein